MLPMMQTPPFQVTLCGVLHFNWSFFFVSHAAPPSSVQRWTNWCISELVHVCACQTGVGRLFGSDYNLNISSSSFFLCSPLWVRYTIICPPCEFFRDLNPHHLEITSATLSRWVLYFFDKSNIDSSVFLLQRQKQDLPWELTGGTVA